MDARPLNATQMVAATVAKTTLVGSSFVALALFLSARTWMEGDMRDRLAVFGRSACGLLGGGAVDAALNTDRNDE
jgi:hypothetical protein